MQDPRLAFNRIPDDHLQRGTLRLAIFATVLGLTVGTLCAIGRTSGPQWLRRAVGGCVEIIRNTPRLIQNHFLIFGLAGATLARSHQSIRALSFVEEGIRKPS